MEKYIVTRDVQMSTYRPIGTNLAQRSVSFKKGDKVEGKFVHIDTNSEGDYYEIKTTSGNVRFPCNRGVCDISLDMRYRGIAPDNKAYQKTEITTKQSISNGAIFGIGLGVIAIGTVLFFCYKK